MMPKFDKAMAAFWPIRLRSGGLWTVLIFCSLVVLFSRSWAGQTPQASGRLEKGYRVLSVPDKDQSPEFRVFRGDYIKFEISGDHAPLLSIPAMDIEAPLSGDMDQAPFFKMRAVGIFDIFIGSAAGTLTVLEYAGAHYQALTALDAARLIQNISPLVLDVRTPGEYKAGHLAHSILIPVQELQKRFGELEKYKNEPVLIYCATGNRSTVASKILIDKGFTRIFNLRHGILDWYKKRLPVVQ